MYLYLDNEDCSIANTVNLSFYIFKNIFSIILCEFFFLYSISYYDEHVKFLFTVLWRYDCYCQIQPSYHDLLCNKFGNNNKKEVQVHYHLTASLTQQSSTVSLSDSAISAQTKRRTAARRSHLWRRLLILYSKNVSITTQKLTLPHNELHLLHTPTLTCNNNDKCQPIIIYIFFLKITFQ